MSVLKLSERIYSVGVLNPNMRIFDVIMATEHGTTYNAYVVKGDSHTALIDAVHENFWDDHLANLNEVLTCQPSITFSATTPNRTIPEA